MIILRNRLFSTNKQKGRLKKDESNQENINTPVKIIGGGLAYLGNKSVKKAHIDANKKRRNK